MKHLRSVGLRAFRRSLAAVLLAGAGLLGVTGEAVVPRAHADQTAYLIGVTVRPGYNFPNAQAALDYGYGICDKVAAGRPFPALMGDVRADFNTSDDYQASYLVSQAVNELCPAQIWALRNSAAHYRPPAGVTP
jgi:hypothetical protein